MEETNRDTWVELFRAAAEGRAPLGRDQFQSTLELKATFLRPVRPGRLVGHGRVVHRIGDIAFLDGSLVDATGRTVAVASATARVIALKDSPAAP